MQFDARSRRASRGKMYGVPDDGIRPFGSNRSAKTSDRFKFWSSSARWFRQLLWNICYSKLNIFLNKFGQKPSICKEQDVVANLTPLMEELGTLGGLGAEGYQLLPAATSAFFVAGLKNAYLGLREYLRATTMDEKILKGQWEQSSEEKKRPARLGIDLAKDLCGEFALALAAVYECNEKGWEISSDDHLGHWIAIVGKAHIPKKDATKPGKDGGIVLDSNRGYERWHVGKEGGLILKRHDKTSDVRVWVYSLITIYLSQRELISGLKSGA